VKILLVKTSSLGDVVHTLPAVTDALKSVPNLKIDWVVEEAFAEIPKWHSGVNEVITVAIRRWRKSFFNSKTRAEIKAVKSQIRSSEYDLVIDAQGLLKSAWVSKWAKAPIHGYDKNSIREPLASIFYKTTYQVSRDLHAVDRIRKLLSQALGYEYDAKSLDYGLSQVESRDVVHLSHFSSQRIGQDRTLTSDCPFLVFRRSSASSMELSERLESALRKPGYQ